MPSNTEYLQAAFGVTVLSFAVYIAYVLIRLRQAQDELRSLLDQHTTNQRATPQSAPAKQRSADPPPAPSSQR
ncbi:MAG: hypothetical protein NTZ05_04730 [Chloroflexi bacterium]|nr:hypothetical protein [Chloroflexota bacterium]